MRADLSMSAADELIYWNDQLQKIGNSLDATRARLISDMSHLTEEERIVLRDDLNRLLATMPFLNECVLEVKRLEDNQQSRRLFPRRKR